MVKKPKEIILGNTIRDIVTGFKGIVTQRVEYLDGRIQLGVEALASKNEEKIPTPQWVGLERAEFVDDGIHAIPYKRGIGFGETRNE